VEKVGAPKKQHPGHLSDSVFLEIIINEKRSSYCFRAESSSLLDSLFGEFGQHVLTEILPKGYSQYIQA